ncbi:odorant receptor 131-2-like [Genypterus blacodes]|uniref:odorant receptor 131-2-like n=1 Tax=Genypterus blacodes TaxID=154954 RepID=UPI003F770836
MAFNVSLVGGGGVMLSDRILVVQVLVAIFLCINFLLIIAFFKKESLYTTMRYMLFALMLLSDSFLLFMSNLLLLFITFGLGIQVWLCLIIYVTVVLYTFVTPITLTAMTLERYVAICMPLRHGELCTTRNALHCILIIHCLSCIPLAVILFTFFATASHSIYTRYQFCSMDVFVFLKWQVHVKLALYQCFFILMSATIIFSYVKIMKVAKGASGENDKLTRKGLRTVTLHAFQLFLCVIQLWCPFVNSSFLQIDFMLYINVRYINYIIFFVAPRCLSPLIYGLRDETFLLALKCNALL